MMAVNGGFINDEDSGKQPIPPETVKYAPLPAEGAGHDSFSNLWLTTLLITLPWLLSWTVGGGFRWTIFFVLFTTIPGVTVFFFLASRLSPRINENIQLPGQPVEYYLDFKNPIDRERYRGRNKIPMWTAIHKYFKGDLDFKGDTLDVLEYRHDWATFYLTWELCRYILLDVAPGIISRNRPRAEGHVKGHYDRGDEFYAWFSGPTMINTAGIISDPSREETLEEMQNNKMALVCEKIGLAPGKLMLDIGCGFGTLARFASVNYGAHVTAVTLGENPAAYGNAALRKAGIPEEQSRIFSMDYRDIPIPGPQRRYDTITCIEMAEHVGFFNIVKFLRQCYDMLEDDGVMLLQVCGLRTPWQYEDLIWGLFVNKYVFPAGADASATLTGYVKNCELAGFEIKGVETIGVHYSATFWRWYKNWRSNKTEATAKYGQGVYRVWEYFLASAAIVCRQGSASCYQITLVKNVNSTRRVEGIPTQFGLLGAIERSKVTGRDVLKG